MTHTYSRIVLCEIAADRRELAAISRALEATLAEIKILRDIIPICSLCKKIRDHAGFWQQVKV